ncbi:MAG: SIMPL domain-containing protein [Owenweeksia sp.]
MKTASWLAAFTFLVWSGTALKAQQANTSPRTIDVIGTAEQVLKPDQVMIQIVIENSEESPKAAQAKTSQAASKALSYLKTKTSIKSIETNYVSLRPQRIDYNKDTYRYVAVQNISFVLEDIGEYQNVIIDLMERGANGIGNVQFESTKREKLEQQLLAQAVRNAREKAVFLATQLEQQVGRAVYIADRIASSGPVPLAFKSSMEMDEAQASIAPGELLISARVNVIFELK